MAYQRGIFPWFSPGDPILWWSPTREPCCAPGQPPEPQHEAFSRKIPLRVTLNHAFGQVIEGCAEDRHEGTWITRDIIIAYHQLHELGYAHSMEVDGQDDLVGGMYPSIAPGTLFCGESMFSRATNASKPRCSGFAGICPTWRTADLIIVLNEHTASLGAVEICRRHYRTP
ncbi:leucyl/phenylalanyl-tRNA--protein transferase [Shigella flexneri]